jgi:glycosyltransferase involved in cell wall biosynthesis
MEQKGFLPLLRALQILADDLSLPPWRLAAVGGGDYLGEYRREAGRLGLADRVSFVDAVPNSGPILRQLDVLAMPSLWEAAGLLAMEALALGVPVVGSDCPGLREVLRGSPSPAPKAGDVDLLTRALRRAIRSPWREAAEAYAPIARARFDARRSAEELLRWIEFAAPPGSPARRGP